MVMIKIHNSKNIAFSEVGSIIDWNKFDGPAFIAIGDTRTTYRYKQIKKTGNGLLCSENRGYELTFNNFGKK